MTAVTRPLGFGRGALALVVLTAAAGVHAVPAQAAVPKTQALAILLDDHVARTRPSASARRIESVPSVLPLTRTRTVLPVLERRGNAWMRVMLPGRPNGHSGWIRTYRTRPSSTAWALRVDLSARRVTAYRGGVVQRRFRAIVGTPSTPTPRGRFFIEEAIRIAASHPGGPYALAVSARSTVLQEFDGGPGQIALHGVVGLPGALGSASSHGCVRLSTAAITWLAARVGRGVPVTVVG